MTPRSLVVVSALLATTAVAQRIAFRQYGMRDGLTNLNVRSLLHDHHGYLWVGTDNGLFRFDGTRFEPFSEGLESREIYALAESPDGVLWAMSAGGEVAAFTGGRFERVELGTTERLARSERLGFDTAGRLYVAHDLVGRLWVSTDNGVLVGDGEGWRHFGAEDGVAWDDGDDLALHGRVWVGTANGLSRFDPAPEVAPVRRRSSRRARRSRGPKWRRAARGCARVVPAWSKWPSGSSPGTPSPTRC